MWPAEQTDILLNTGFVLMNQPKDEDIKFKLSAGEISGKIDVYKPLLEALGRGPKTVGELLSVSSPTPRTLKDTVQAVTLMLHAGFVGLHRPVAEKKPAKALNRTIVENVARGGPYNYLIAAEIGNILQVKHADMMMLYEILNDPAVESAEKLSHKLVSRLATLGRALVKDGQALQDEKSVMSYASTLAEEFLDTTLEHWKKIGVV